MYSTIKCLYSLSMSFRFRNARSMKPSPSSRKRIFFSIRMMIEFFWFAVFRITQKRLCSCNWRHMPLDLCVRVCQQRNCPAIRFLTDYLVKVWINRSILSKFRLPFDFRPLSAHLQSEGTNMFSISCGIKLCIEWSNSVFFPFFI